MKKENIKEVQKEKFNYIKIEFKKKKRNLEDDDIVNKNLNPLNSKENKPMC